MSHRARGATWARWCAAPTATAEALTQEVELYDRWANGEIYSYVIERRDPDGWNEVDSCTGFYSEQEAREQGIAAVPDTLPDDA